MRPNLLERAFELAQSGRYRTVTELSAGLKSEGYAGIAVTLSGGSIRKQLRDLMRQAGAKAS